MKRHKWVVAIVMLGLLVVFACQSGNHAKYGAAGLATGQPGMNTYPSADPGETSVLPRAYAGAPPVVPHSVVGLMIDRTTNDCLDCHLEGDEVEEGHVATAVPQSHFVNEHTGARTVDGVTGVRYNCLQCHVPQAEVAGVPTGKK